MDKNTGTDNVVQRLSGADTKAARPRAEVLAEVMDPGRAKSEHEHVAADEIAALRDERDEASASATEASTALADALARVEALEAALRERDGGDHDRECRIWMSNWQKREDRYCNCGHVEAAALLEQKP